MQPKTKKLKLIFLVASLALSVVLLLDGVINSAEGLAPTPIGRDSLSILKSVLIFVSAYALVVAWFIQFRRTAILDRLRARRLLLAPDTAFLLTSYTSLIAPAFCGILLYYCGMPLRELFYFVGAAMAMMLAWGLYDMRKA